MSIIICTSGIRQPKVLRFYRDKGIYIGEMITNLRRSIIIKEKIFNRMKVWLNG
ncbi:hypothetical protein SAMN05661091_2471 [Paenibacillus uliginis N3/975]|uniref:Uncharacterized protein n=1 Tax=Paenibacillus uliginis N3/975 TaxID=1313296 RepID=A0A1X7HCI3_9BACL|nr:hypothetical protein SAMN05661091_2471 [Paenibacillus uliginis N3/975]